jgi:hypothetical protein
MPLDDEGRRRLVGLTEMLGRTGAASAQFRFSDDEQPVVWMAVALYPGGRWEVAAGHGPIEAGERLCEQVVDGGVCTHCQRPTMFDPDPAGASPIDVVVCAYRWDPELATYRRSCEGRT